MVGYPESLTDPSYRGQILLMTYPIVGNYGVPPGVKDEWGLNKYWESSIIQPKGLIMSDYCHDYSHWEANQSLHEWLQEFKVPAITGLDTRQLTKIIRRRGEMNGKIVINGQDVAQGFNVAELDNPVADVSRKRPMVYNRKGKYKVLAIDCGMKDSMLRQLLEHDMCVKVVPYNYDISKEKEDFDGVFLSNGPGDPARNRKTVENLRDLFKGDRPVFGICLGTQIMALAAGGGTYKLPFGHRGHNQPVTNVHDNRCYITSQNHSYAVSKNLPDGWTPLFVNANDGSLEGICHKTKPFFSVQFHPEARCGPEDTAFLFKDFVQMCERYRKQRSTASVETALGFEKANNALPIAVQLTAPTKKESILTNIVEFEKGPSIKIPKKVLVLGSGKEEMFCVLHTIFNQAFSVFRRCFANRSSG